MLSALVGTRFGNYLLVERLGADGVAEIFRGVLRGDEGGEQVVLLELLRPEFADDTAVRAQFHDEARPAFGFAEADADAAGCRTIDRGEVDGRVFVAHLVVDEQAVAHVVARLADPACVPHAELAPTTRWRQDLLAPTMAPASAGPDTAARPVRTAITPPRRSDSSALPIAVVLGLVILGAGAIALLRLALPGESAAVVDTPPDDAAASLPDATADASPDAAAAAAAPYTLVATASAAERARLDAAVARHDSVVRVGRLTPDYALFLTLLDLRLAGLVLDDAGHAEPGAGAHLPAALIAVAAARPSLVAAVDAVIAYVAGTGELPAAVALAARRALASGSAVRAVAPEPALVIAATLAAWLAPARPDRLTDLARAAWALPPVCPAITLPRRRFAPLACDTVALDHALREAGKATTADALERYRAAQSEVRLAGAAVRVAEVVWSAKGGVAAIELVATGIAIGMAAPDPQFRLLAGDLDGALRSSDALPLLADAGSGTRLRFESLPASLFAPVLELVVGDQRTLLRVPPPVFAPAR